MRILSSLALLCTAALGLAAAEPATRPPVVITANTILDDLVRQVGGGQVRTHCFVASGDDPHAFEPRPADVKQLVGADLLVVNGLNLEPTILKLAAGSGFKGEIVVATTGIQPRLGFEDDDHEEHDHTASGAHDHGSPSSASAPATGHRAPATGSADPHAWQDPRLVATYVTNIRDVLARANPSAAALYAARAASYLEQLTALDRWVRAQVATIPAAHRKLVTSHDSLGYFAAAYGFETVPVAGISSSAEPDARAVAGIIDLIRREHVPAVFIELTINPKLLRQLAADAGVRLADPLYTDSLGAPGSGAETYLDLFRTNVTRIVAALR